MSDLVVKLLVSALALSVAMAAFTPLVGKLSTSSLAWLGFFIFVSALPWLPISEFALGSASIKLFQTQAVASDKSSISELRQFEQSTDARLKALAGQVSDLSTVNQKDKSRLLGQLQSLRKDAAASQAKFAAAAAQTDAAHNALAATAGVPPSALPPPPLDKCVGRGGKADFSDPCNSGLLNLF